ncbi:MAG: ribosome silencing factor [Candidatus Marinimicrobia bacterium]|nr:ribosome silencing factor [Candidatus Neomarinimicrobiota bacterium]MBL7022852.1 ribosome silencing factor [Candidatus Neomarinimicrobiota bacterium]MBL7110048.1 ribosome silencing factor [Candidatus Neomarinimicrobiota bacterium]
MTKKQVKNEPAKDIALKISELIASKKGNNIKIFDVRKLTTLTDFFIVCSSESNPQTMAIVNTVVNEMKKDDIRPWHVEGMEHQQWILIDYVNIVVHIFKDDVRDYYEIERLWADAEITTVEDEQDK